jgi:hypothetical protein
MKFRKHSLIGLVLVLTASALASPPDKSSRPALEGFVVHEWGTFLTMSGSDGVVLDSMYHEEHALPDFVHSVKQDELHMPGSKLKFETPVIYFYTKQSRIVDVKARFTSGIWTHWFPKASKEANYMSRPGSQASSADDENRYGCLNWHVDLVPPSQPSSVLLPSTPPDSLWNFARQVDAAYVRTVENDRSDSNGKGNAISTEAGKNEVERYIFYRGLGHANLPLEVNALNGGTLSLSGSSAPALKHLFVLRVEGGRGVFRYIPEMRPDQSLDHMIPDMQNAEPLTDFTTHVGDALAARLEASGLYAKEARAMVNTWRSSYFQSEGVRVLYVLPQTWTESFIPLQITPRPDNLVRVMVGRVELLTPAREQEIASAVRRSSDTDTMRRAHALATLYAQGRYIEPILRRLLRVSSDPAVRAGCRKLLLTDWVNDIRPPAATLAGKG